MRYHKTVFSIQLKTKKAKAKISLTKYSAYHNPSNRYPRYPQPTTFDVTDFYIPMKTFQFNAFREISEMCKDTNYANVQHSQLFKHSLSDDKIIDDILSNDPDKPNKVLFLHF